MQDLTIKEMIEAGAHFGHQTKRWNPKMKPYLYGIRSGVHIIDLQQTYFLARHAWRALTDIVANGQMVLFVGTKPQAQATIVEEAQRCSMPYVSQRWLGGMLTNFITIRRSVERLIELEARRKKNDFAGFTKKELLNVDREIEKLEASLGGIKNMKRIPGAVFVVDPHQEKIAVHEANVLDVPVVAITDSNCDPDPVNHLIPGNDDSTRSIKAFVTRAADACLKGLEARQAQALVQEDEKPEGSKRRRKPQDIEGAGKAYVSRADTLGEKEVESFSATVNKEEKVSYSEELAKEEGKKE